MSGVLVGLIGFVAGSLLVGSFAFWLGIRFGVLIVAEQYKREIQAQFPMSGSLSK